MNFKEETNNKKNFKYGCVGCLSIIIFSFIVGAIITFMTHENKNKPQTSRQRSTSPVEINKYLAILRENDITDALVVNVSAGRIEGEITISVSNAWHMQTYQVRLQAAQNLWKLWSALQSPAKPDNAYIRIVDYNNNQVGGSRGGAGSLIGVHTK